ncbi:hypothetical protein [Cognaticolwellia aestuarii]|uniref:hypothetical protein n=1 Tax=Cognaticolwellia aestuarii TaxID=329993 RepID=UPI000985E5D9|nr:hypothetical protein [Cognaticolwellia aestuarii]
MSQLEIMTNENDELVFLKGGRQLTSRILESKAARRVKECALICTELDDSIYWLKELKELVTHNTISLNDKTDESEKFARDTRAYFTSACVTYFKFFTHGFGMSVKVDANKIYDKSQLEIHNSVEELRHKLIAHIDVSEDFTHELYAIEDPEKEFKPSIVPFFSRTNHFFDEKLDSFIELVEFLKDYFHSQYEGAGKSLMKETFGK